MEIRHIQFSELRTAYSTVQQFLYEKTLESDVHSLNFKIEKDGWIYGDDIVEMIVLFSKTERW